MKTPLNVLEDVIAQVSEGSTLLKMIYRITDETNEEVESALACLIRSLDNTRDTANEFIEDFYKDNNSSMKTERKRC